MNLHSIRVKSTIPMALLAFTLVLVIAMFSYLSAMQKSALDAQANNFLKAISLVLNADRDLYQAKLATTFALNKVGDLATQQQDAQENAAQVKQRFADYLQHLAQLDFFVKADEVFQQLQQSSRRVNEMATQTAAATEEQSLVSEEITKNLYALNDQAMAAGKVAEKNEQLSVQIRQLSDAIFGLVGRFKVN